MRRGAKWKPAEQEAPSTPKFNEVDILPLGAEDIFTQIKRFGGVEGKPSSPQKQEDKHYKDGKKWYEDKKRSWKLLNATPDFHYEQRFSQKRAEFEIKEALMDMAEFDFMVSNARIPFDVPTKKCVRTIHLGFSCYNCEPTHRFSSHCGTSVIRFLVEKKEPKGEWKDKKHPYLVSFNLRFYNMRCADCKCISKSRIYESHLEALQIQFANIITQIIAGVKVKRSKKTKFAPDVHGHRSDLCEACQSGLCMAKRTLDGWKEHDQIATKKKRRRQSNSDSDFD